MSRVNKILKNFLVVALSIIITFNSSYAQPQQPEVQNLPSLEPVVKPIKFNIGLLEISAEFIPEGVPSPYRGYILRRSDVALLQTVVDRLPDDFSRECDARIGACIDEVSSCQEECNQRVSATIEELEQTKELLTSERENHDSTKLRYTLYGFSGAIVSSLTTVLILRIAK